MEKKLLDFWKSEEKTPFKGWDFSYLKNRLKQGSPPWNYLSIAKMFVKESKSVLDIATGGGEVFSMLAPFPKKAVATEGYYPNIAIARSRLEPLGAKVIHASETINLPFKNNEFGLILNRHGGLNIREISRVLSSGGKFLTQQVDSRNLDDLVCDFGKKPKTGTNMLGVVKKQLKKSGMKIKQSNEWSGSAAFKDVGAVVYFLKAIPWIIGDFSVSKYLPCLEKLQEKIAREGELKYTIRRFLILAEKPPMK